MVHKSNFGDKVMHNIALQKEGNLFDSAPSDTKQNINKMRKKRTCQGPTTLGKPKLSKFMSFI